MPSLLRQTPPAALYGMAAQGLWTLLLVGESGAGKSTLAASYLREHGGLPSCWYGLEESDADPHTFLTYLHAALARLRAASRRRASWPRSGKA